MWLVEFNHLIAEYLNFFIIIIIIIFFFWESNFVFIIVDTLVCMFIVIKLVVPVIPKEALGSFHGLKWTP